MSLLRTSRYAMSSSAKEKVKTGILMLNMGGPKKADEVQEFLTRLFLDRDIIKLPLQERLGPLIAKRRTPSIIEKYNEIGGGSPIFQWTTKQGNEMCKILDEVSPETAPHKSYVGFRYAEPLTEDTLEEMENDGVEHAVAFSQYPQYSCTTSGSSMTAIYQHYANRGSPTQMKWRFIDRWSTHSPLIKTFAENIRKELESFDAAKRKDVVILFSAHSIPQYVMDRGDPYPAEVGATVQLVMQELGWSNPFRLVWQSKVGPLPWLKPGTEQTIETLHELDIEYAKDIGEKHGAEKIARCPTPNDHPIFIQGLADLVHSSLKDETRVRPQLLLRCPMCTNANCGKTKHWIRKIAKM